MKVRRKDNEDAEDFDELMAQNITEAVCDQFSDWMAEPVSLTLKADIYHRVRQAQAAALNCKGV